ncbi:transmembrane protein, putative [Medicago truncatula]|uniref:Transmembrane protein, putative n=1 Tax=Medicago truncatula TaxID=3880 RepID=A0A072U8H4_MEDTR|nr:transmembrane protein, putative [Medicago truncatula]
MEGSLKLALMFVVFFVAIALSLVGNTYATRQGVYVEENPIKLHRTIQPPERI